MVVVRAIFVPRNFRHYRSESSPNDIRICIAAKPGSKNSYNQEEIWSSSVDRKCLALYLVACALRLRSLQQKQTERNGL